MFRRAQPTLGPDGRLGGGTERLDRRGGISRAIHGRSGDEDVRAGLSGALDGRARDPAVDLDGDFRSAALNGSARAADLRQGYVEESLATEAGLDGHDEQHAELGEHGEVRLERGR